ncbi:MAG TPA: TonB-dependent receptor [Acetobacteraceae bacterium]|nr:TonB-dependent receptor [Acetobacteraceae bacterium]
MRLGYGAAAALVAMTGQAAAQAGNEATLPPIEIVGTAPLAGGAEQSRIPANTYVLPRSALVRTGPASLTRALDEEVGGVALNEAQGNPFQPSLTYRGFEASPLAGSPQGLAVYVNGTRFNQPFGETTNWDLIPDVAIERVELVGSDPTFGLNAIGGAITVKLRDGFTYHGAQLEVSGGSFGRIQGSAQYGVQSGNTAAYMAVSGLNETGWRDHSPSQLRQVFGDIGYRGDKSEVHLSVIGAINNLTGNGSTPVELLAASRSAVFTYPDATRNKYLRTSVTGSYEVSEQVSLQASAYYSNLAQRTYNGNAADVEPCDDNRALLCFNNGQAVTGRDGSAVPNFVNPGFFPGLRQFRRGGPYAELDETATDSNAFGASLQATYRSELLGRSNRLIAGASLDGGETMFSARSSLGALAPDRGYVGPGIVIDQADGSRAPVRVAASTRYYGLYAQDMLDVTEALTLTVSGRLNLAQVDLRDQVGTSVSGNHDYAHFNPAAGLTYNILPAVTAYAGYAVSNRAPTPAELSCASAASPCSLTNFFVADPSLKQVVAGTFEAGLRGRFRLGDAELAWKGGVFRVVSDDDILFIGSTVTGRGFFQNVGQTRREGVEAGLRLRYGPVSAYFDYAHTSATFRTPFTASSPNNPAADADGLIQVSRGDRIPGIPQHRLKLGVQYEVTPRWTVGATGILSSGRVLQGDEANLNPRTGSYVVFNANTNFRLTETIELFGLVQNVSNTRYATFGGFSPVQLVPILQAPGASDTRSLTPGAPIAGYGGVRVTF